MVCYVAAANYYDACSWDLEVYLYIIAIPNLLEPSHAVPAQDCLYQPLQKADQSMHLTSWPKVVIIHTIHGSGGGGEKGPEVGQ